MLKAAYSRLCNQCETSAGKGKNKKEKPQGEQSKESPKSRGGRRAGRVDYKTPLSGIALLGFTENVLAELILNKFETHFKPLTKYLGKLRAIDIYL